MSAGVGLRQISLPVPGGSDRDGGAVLSVAPMEGVGGGVRDRQCGRIALTYAVGARDLRQFQLRDFHSHGVLVVAAVTECHRQCVGGAFQRVHGDGFRGVAGAPEVGFRKNVGITRESGRQGGRVAWADEVVAGGGGEVHLGNLHENGGGVHQGEVLPGGVGELIDGNVFGYGLVGLTDRNHLFGTVGRSHGVVHEPAQGAHFIQRCDGGEAPVFVLSRPSLRKISSRNREYL